MNRNLLNHSPLFAISHLTNSEQCKAPVMNLLTPSPVSDYFYAQDVY